MNCFVCFGSGRSAELEARSKRIVRFQGVALAYLVRLKEGLLEGRIAEGVDLFVAKKEINGGALAEGTTIRLERRYERNGSCIGTVSYVEGKVEFHVDEVRFKPRNEWTTEDVAEHFVLPMTQGDLAFMLDKIEKKFVGPRFKGTFVSQARKCKFVELVESLELEFQGQNLNKVFVWVDFISANQPLLTNSDRNLDEAVVQDRMDLLNHGLHEAIKHFDDRLVFFDKWKDPKPLKRSWCVWEIFGSIREDKRIRAIFPPGQDQDFLEILLADPEKIMQKVSDIDTRRASCFKAEDQEMIAQAVESTLERGFVTLNAVILNNLRNWLADITHLAVKKSRQNRKENHAELCNQAGFFLQNLGAFDVSLKYYREALKIFESVSGQGIEIAICLNNIASVFRAQEKYAEALTTYNRVLQIRREKLGGKHKDVADALNNVGIVHNELGSLDEALKCFEEALAIRSEKLDRPKSSELQLASFMNLVVLPSSGNRDDSKNLEEAVDVELPSKLGERELEVAKTLSNLGAVHFKRGAFRKAIQHYEEALSIQTEKLGERHPNTAFTMTNIGLVHMARNDFEFALSSLEPAYQVLLEALGPEHPHTKIASEAIVKCGQKINPEAFSQSLNIAPCHKFWNLTPSEHLKVAVFSLLTYVRYEVHA